MRHPFANLLIMAALVSPTAMAQTSGEPQAIRYEDYFNDAAIRIDYTLAGNASHQAIYLDQLTRLPHWAGRRHNLDQMVLKGNAQLKVRARDSGRVIYSTSFSTLFQEWIAQTDEPKSQSRSYESCMLIPMPRQKVEVEVTLFDAHQDTMATLRHELDPNDILIERYDARHTLPHRYLHRGTASNCIDIAILAEGYTREEMTQFYQDAEAACRSLLSHEPFDRWSAMLNIVAVESTSEESGVSIPKEGVWRKTAFSSHFSTFYSERYLTSLHIKEIHSALAGIDYEHIIILANTKTYGGGGIYNTYALTAAHHPQFAPVIVHEFGHSFAGLADEYFYENDVATDSYALDIEPWEGNITTRKDPEKSTIGKVEGGAYSAKGIWRFQDDCRMRTNTFPSFCPACQAVIEKVIRFYTE